MTVIGNNLSPLMVESVTEKYQQSAKKINCFCFKKIFEAKSCGMDYKIS